MSPARKEAKDKADQPDRAVELRMSAVDSIAEVSKADWDACANPYHPVEAESATSATPCPPGQDSSLETTYNPFVSHDFLSALEESKSVGGRTGWHVQHVLAKTSDGTLVAAAPAYLKSHSRGEYVFDAGWAEAYARAGGSYYPKLQISVPFTPATGPRLLVRDGLPAPAVRRALAQGLTRFCGVAGASGVHVTFATEAEYRLLGELGYLQRTDQQFHWENQNFASFDDFLSALASRKRKTLRRERQEALSNGITVHWLTGSDLTEDIWDAFFTFYMETGSRKWGRPYLTREFYSLVGAKMRDRILLVMAKRAGRWIAGAINFIGSHTLFGRHWGAVEHHPFLHFELCYYQAIDYAIAHKMQRVEAGAHYIADPGLRRAIADYLVRERAYVAAAGEELSELAPFRKDLAAETE